MAERSSSDYFVAPYPRVFAHRGLAEEAPENSLLAFAKALASGATHVETDVHVSLDGIAVVSHDAQLGALGRDVRIDQLTMNELRRVDLGHGQAYPSLADALEAFPEARFNIDVKTDAAVVPTARAIRAARASRRVLVTSFKEARRRTLVSLLPDVVSSASSRLVAYSLAATSLGLTRSVERTLRGCLAVQIPERAASVHIVTPRYIEMMHRVGVEVHVWTVNAPADMNRLLELGVDGLITDRPDLARDVITRRT